MTWLWWACTEPRPERTCDTSGVICTWLGVPGQAASTPEGQFRTRTSLYLPLDIAFDPSGTAYYADFNNHVIRRVRRDGIVLDVAGGAHAGDADCTDGCTLAAARWNSPADVVVDPRDPTRLWVASWGNHEIVLIDLAAKRVFDWAGDAAPHSFDDGPRHEASFDRPSSLAIAPDGTMYVSDSVNQVIRQIRPDGEVTTLAGTPRRLGYAGDGGPARDALFHGATEESREPSSQIALAGRKLLVSDSKNGVIRAVNLDTGVIDRIAGTYTSAGTGETFDPATQTTSQTDLGSKWGYGGDGGPAREAVFAGPHGLAAAPDGTIYVADTGNHCVRRITPDGRIGTFAGVCGNGGFGGDRGLATDALLWHPFGVSIGPDGAVFIADTQNHVIRRVAP